MVVLVTGGTGFVAGHCIAELIASGHDVRTTVRSAAGADLAHLRAVAAECGRALEVVEASLTSDAGWAKALDGSEAVLHVASPAPARVPKDPDELVRPAVEGTIRVLRAAAASGTVGRVVLTSSTDAVTAGFPRADDRPRTEADWSDTEHCAPYPLSKTLAERAAWEFAAEYGLDLVAINPGLVLGPLQRPAVNVSTELIRRLLARDLPGVPRLHFSVVDVRDVAVAHRLALETPTANGRSILAAEELELGAIARLLAEEYGPRVPTRPMPSSLMWLAGRFDPTIRLAATMVGVRRPVSAAKARRELGWIPRPAREAVLATAQSLIDLQVVASQQLAGSH